MDRKGSGGKGTAAGKACADYPVLTAIAVLPTEEDRLAGLQLAVDGV